MTLLDPVFLDNFIINYIKKNFINQTHKKTHYIQGYNKSNLKYVTIRNKMKLMLIK